MIRRRGKARFLSTGGVTTPSPTSRSSGPGRSIGTIRATALPWSVTTIPNRTGFYSELDGRSCGTRRYKPESSSTGTRWTPPAPERGLDLS